MRAPIKKLVERLHQKGFCDGEGVARSKTNWVCLEVKHIIELFNSTNRGLLNYRQSLHRHKPLFRHARETALPTLVLSKVR